MMLTCCSYNSSVYSSVYTSDYLIVMATEDSIASNATSHSLGIDSNDPWYYNYSLPGPTYFYGNEDILLDITNDTLGILSSNLYASAVAQNLTRLNASECISDYATTFPTKQGNLILVTNNATQTPYVTAYDTIAPLNDVYAGCPAKAFDWICNQEVQPGEFLSILNCYFVHERSRA